ncbi:peptide-methionine (S)-S-oxide reductase MsrA [Elioraea tepida]|jgi:peptide-methionine (S)-S-oxide reductase|uniref:Peptide methionine sulfoxide reductase MsrA n=1 Tax=Elioraea tepida TaxID=2843330 RepID=A0A975TZJ3_9PROT|nr:peptide-methionine (S)-S-oxide reductase MsrA [Elioraea tepida]QXM23387.1 peptide-methionine (S)-S-oxide reductase MsrA [Elioraea tepida]
MTQSSTRALATLGGGCFWCLEPIFRALEGVEDVTCGYAGGHVPNPTYELVCGKRTGHAEVVQIAFDPAVIDYADLLRVFFSVHDPTTKDAQGADVGPQYRSIILTHDEEQARTARAVMAEVEASRLWPAPLTTEVVPLTTFWPAEPEHQRYFERNPWAGYCRVVIAPKVAKFRKAFAARLKAA